MGNQPPVQVVQSTASAEQQRAAAPIAAPPRPSQPSLSCVVPAHNEAANLPTLLEMLTAQLQKMSPSWEIVIVDDGSRDETVMALAPWLTRPGVVCLQLSRNFGKEAALGAGLDHARGDVVFTLDADLQHPVSLLPDMLAVWREGADMVYAVRRDRSGESAIKRIGTRMFYALMKFGSSIDIPPNAGDFRLLDRCVVEAVCALPERTRFMKGLYAWVGFRSRSIDFDPPPRTRGSSGFGLKALLSLAASGITAFSNLPLRLGSALGTVLALIAIAYGIWVVIEHFTGGHDVPGWTTIVAGLMFFSGIQLLTIGILGEYLGRVYDEVKRRPRYLVARRLGRSPFDPPVPPR
ncbi:MAG TPA: glycosyltransferase family 2 protein [Burkholderiaceae bacterium]|jgi:glycosyltransferase involved in cell wall biosynthesis|nr:glycosyltransferase family 2 protein [Burkholderiaceae bacterium]